MSSDPLVPPAGRVFPASQLLGGLLDGLSPVVLGGGVFGTDYNSLDSLKHSSVVPDTLRLCLRYGINAVDTSPYYSCSEEVLGKAFETIADEFPRESYMIITKAGRYGREKADFDYSPERVRKSVKSSLKKMKTTYLDGLYMHDVEFVSEQVDDAGHAGFKVDAEGRIREGDLKRWGLANGDEGVIRGPGDEKVLGAMRTLFELKKEGVVRWVGFSGYPLPTLLRLARLVAFHLEPLDIVQSYSHHCLQNTSLSAYLPLFYASGVKQVITASPLSMGILRDIDPPAWHPASEEMKAATREATKAVAAKGARLQDVALGYGLTSALREGDAGAITPTVVGLSSPDEVHATMKVYGALYRDTESRRGRAPGEGLSEANVKEMELEKLAVDCFKKSGTLNWTWAVGV
ncbi:hypothetical protein MNV49_006666 [Pseudohyphozyma bogoriensis]|nr:hypothetical protein MNV49_006666 [Pseudohyphozyma bogoriensis]